MAESDYAVERSGPFFNARHLASAHRAIPSIPPHAGIFKAWDGYFWRRMRWTGREWRHLRGWLGTFPQLIGYAL